DDPGGHQHLAAARARRHRGGGGRSRAGRRRAPGPHRGRRRPGACHPADPRAPRPRRGRPPAARADRGAGAGTRPGAPARRGGGGLAEGGVVAAAGVELRVGATPGHTADSLCFLATGPVPGRVGRVDGEGASQRGPNEGRTERGAEQWAQPGAGAAVLTGDTILGRGTAVVAHPDGRLADSLTSLRRRAELGPVTVLPGHGPELPDAAAVAARYLAHREERLAQVRDALAELGSGATAGQVVELVYADVAPAVRWAAELSVRAQLDYLRGG